MSVTQKSFDFPQSFHQRYFHRLDSEFTDVKPTREQAGRILDEMVEHECEARKQRGSKKSRNQLFDTICRACGRNSDQVTKVEAKRIATAISAIKAVMPEVGESEIERRATLYRQKHPQWELTPMALACHWSEFGGIPTKVQSVYDEPAGWRTVAHKIHPGLIEREWRDICVAYGPKILSLLGSA